MAEEEEMVAASHEVAKAVFEVLDDPVLPYLRDDSDNRTGEAALAVQPAELSSPIAAAGVHRS